MNPPGAFGAFVRPRLMEMLHALGMDVYRIPGEWATHCGSRIRRMRKSRSSTSSVDLARGLSVTIIPRSWPKTVLECYQQADLESQRGLQAARYQPTPPTDTSAPIVATGNAG